MSNNPKVIADPTWYVGTDTMTTLAAGGFGNVARKVVTFDGTANKGAIGAVPLFTVTSAVLVRIVAICTVDLTCGAGATLSVGTAAATAGIIAVTGAVDIDAGEIWFAAAPATKLDTVTNSILSFVIGDGSAIKGTVAVDTVNTGSITFTCFWTPLTATGNVVAA
jgi:hypothetical protein